MNKSSLRAQNQARSPTLDKLAEGFLAYTFAKKKAGTVRGYDNALRLPSCPSSGPNA